MAVAHENKIAAGLKDALRYARGDHSRGKAYRVEVAQPVDVRAIREKFGLSQAEFARKFGFPRATLRGWEQGRRAPSLASRNYLLVIAKQPHAVEAALAA